MTPPARSKSLSLKQVKKLRQDLQQLRKAPYGRKAKELENFAKAVGRSKSKRGKEPTWIREDNPELTPPLSIPNHAADMKVGTFLSIVDQLISDCDDWEIHIQNENDDD